MKRFLLTFLVCIISQLAHAQLPITFDQIKHYGGNFINGTFGYKNLTSADINGDNYNDVIISSFNYISILTSSGTGSLNFFKNINVGSTPSGIVAGDINSDGKNDLIVANLNDNNVTILYNDNAGTGNFSSSINFGVGPNPTVLAMGDWQNDGKKDLAVLNHGNSSIFIFTGTGTGTFVKTATITLSGTDLIGLEASDVDGDLKPDLVCIDKVSNMATFLINNGAGKFLVSSSFTVLKNPTMFRLSDLNNDSKSDLAVSNGKDTISFHYNYSSSNYQSAKRLVLNTNGGNSTFEIADLNNDNIPELITQTNSINVLTQTGTLNFSISGVYTTTSNLTLNLVYATDLNNDGLKDINTTSYAKHNTFLNTGGNHLSFSNVIDMNGLADYQIFNLNQDGKDDLLGFRISGSDFLIYTNTGSDFKEIVKYASSTFLNDMTTGDINVDGKDDILALNLDVYTIAEVFTNPGPGTMNIINLPNPNKLTEARLNFYCKVKDLNNDGKNEIGIVSYLLFPNNSTGISIYSMSASGYALSNYITLTGTNNGSIPNNLIFEDLDGNNLPEILIYVNGSLLIYKNLGNFNFSAPIQYSLNFGNLSGIKLADLNGDNRSEIVIGYNFDAYYSIFINDGNGNFSTADYPIDHAAFSLSIYDMNQDGQKDILLSDGADINIMINQGAGNFIKQYTISPGYHYKMSVSNFFDANKPSLMIGHLSGFENINYSVLNNLSIPGALTQTIKPITNVSVPYSSQPLNFNVTVSSNLPVYYTSSNSSILQISSTSGILKGIGIVTITAYSTGGNGFSPVSTTGVVTITKGNLTVTALNISRSYGSANIFTSSIAGLVGTDLISIAYVSSATSTTGIGLYLVSPSVSGLDLYKYNLNTVAGLLTVSSAIITVTAGNVTKKYGNPNPAFSSSVTGLLFNEVPLLTYMTSVTSLTGVGDYQIIPSISGAFLANYVAIARNGTLSIAKADLTVTALNATKNSGTADPEFTSTVSGLINNDLLNINYSISGFSLGKASILPLVGGASLSNYNLYIVDGTLTLYSKLSQSITFSKLPELTLSGSVFTLNATATSGLVVTYVLSDDTIATLVGNQLLPLRVGVGIVTAYQAGNDIYEAATPVSQLLKIVAISSNTNTLTGINTSDGTSQISIKAYPNPTDGFFTIESSRPIAYKIYDSKGQIIEETELESYTSEIQGLCPGLYMIVSGMNKLKVIVK